MAALGQRLRAMGLSERAVLACFGGSCVIHAPMRARAARAMALARGQAEPIIPPAALLAHLFVGGRSVPEPALRRRLGADLDLLATLGLVDIDADTDIGAGAVTAAVTMLPVGPGLVLSDRADRQQGPDVVAVPDDSAFHLIGAVPAGGRGAGARWLDVGTGSAIVPLARPDAAAMVLATDIHARAVSMAALGAALSGRAPRDSDQPAPGNGGQAAPRDSDRSPVTTRVADLLAHADRDGPWDLITFNAPIPRDVLDTGAGASLYRQSEHDLAARFWREVQGMAENGLLPPGGQVLVHSWQPDVDYPARLALPGRVVAVRYTPPDEAVAFGITAWQPDGVPDCRLVRVPLSERTPHLTRAMLETG